MPDTQAFPYPRAAVTVIVMKGNQILIGQRKGKNSDNTWGLPGGKLEMFEELETCGERETMEECGVKIKNIRRGPYVNGMNYGAGKHYLTVILIADWDSEEPQLKEPDKFYEWRWCKWEEIPKPIFYPLKLLVETGYRPPNANN